MAFEVLRRKRKARLPARSLRHADAWTAWWLGSIFYALLLLFGRGRAGRTAVRRPSADAALGRPSPFALCCTERSSARTRFRRERVEVPVAGLLRGGTRRIVQLSDLHSAGTSPHAPATHRPRAARLRPDVWW